MLILAGLGYWYFTKESEPVIVENTTQQPATTTPVQQVVVDKTKTVLGKSVQGRDIMAYHFGEGEKEILIVGGMHGGYSWNTSLLSFELMDYYRANAAKIPASVKVTIVPVLNPDGLSLVVGTSSVFTKADVSSSESTRIAGRFNGHEVDLNRNFDCDWKSSGTWQSRQVSGGTSAFSEPESQALRSYVEMKKPAAAIVFYSAAGGVFPSQCGEPLTETLALTDAYAKVSGYKAFADFDFYEITGDMPNWLSKIGVPAISVLLTSHETTEWTKNQKGVETIVNRFK